MYRLKSLVTVQYTSELYLSWTVFLQLLNIECHVCHHDAKAQKKRKGDQRKT